MPMLTESDPRVSAEVLSDINAESTAVEQGRDKFKRIIQCVAGNPLNGETRLL